MNITSTFSSFPISIRCACALSAGLALSNGHSSRADDVVYISNGDGASPAKWTGQIVDYTGRELRLQTLLGKDRTFPAARVTRVNTKYTAEHLAADELFAAGQFQQALEQYRLALSGKREPRLWVRRQIYAQIIWCCRDLGQWEQACDGFLTLLASDVSTPYFDCMPLTWRAGEPTPTLEQKAKHWLAQTDSPAIALLGASHLLSTAQRPAALAGLKRLSADKDPRVAWLAQAQLWRTTAFNASEAQLDDWRRAIDKSPAPLRAGACFVVGGALVSKRPRQAAELLLQLPILYPREHALSAAALLTSAGCLEQLADLDGAQTLYRELLSDYPSTPEATAARRRLETTASDGASAKP